MNYTKPEVTVLGEADRLIRFTGKGNSNNDAPPPGSLNNAPAYDLDE